MTCTHATRPNTPIRPLPVTVHPLPGELWSGYLRRCAGTFGLQPRDLLRDLFEQWPISSHRASWLPVDGSVAMCPATLELTAQHLRLRPEQITAMQLGRYAPYLWGDTSDECDRFDPINRSWQRRTGPPCWVTPLSRPRCCAQCVAEEPGLMLIAWVLPWVVLCPRHRVPIEAVNGPEGVAGAGIHWEEAGRQQERLWRALENGTGIGAVPAPEAWEQLKIALWCLAHEPAEGIERWNPSPARVAAALPAAMLILEEPPQAWPAWAVQRMRNDRLQDHVRAVLNARRYGSEGLRHAMVQLTGCEWFADKRDLPLPERFRWEVPRRWRRAVDDCLPALIPSDLFAEHLGDFTPSSDFDRARYTAGVTLRMTLTGETVSESRRAFGARSNSYTEVRSTWRQLEAQGRVEDYFTAIRRVGAILMEHQTSYRLRRAAMYALYEDGWRDPSGRSHLPARLWATREWACQPEWHQIPRPPTPQQIQRITEELARRMTGCEDALRA